MKRLMLMMCLAGMMGCAQMPGMGLSKGDRAAIERASQRWEDAVNAKDFAAVAATYEKDAVLLPPGRGSVQGRAAIQQFLTGYPPFSDMRLDVVEVDGRGGLAYAQ